MSSSGLDADVRIQVQHTVKGVEDIRTGIKGLITIITSERLVLNNLRQSLVEANLAHEKIQKKNEELRTKNLLLKEMHEHSMQEVLSRSMVIDILKKENRRCHLKLKFIKHKSVMRKKRLDMLKEKQKESGTKITSETLSNLIEEEHAEDLEETTEEETEEEKEGLDYGGGGGGSDIEDVEQRKEDEAEYDKRDINEAQEIYNADISKEKLKKQSRLSLAKKAADLSRDLRHAINAVKSDKMPSVTFDSIEDSRNILKFAHDRLTHFEDVILELNIMMTRSNKLPAKLFEFKQELVKKIFQSEHIKNLTDIAIKSKFYKTIMKDLTSTYTATENLLTNLLYDIDILYVYFMVGLINVTNNEQLKKIYNDLLSGGVKSNNSNNNNNNNNNNNSSSSSSFKSSSSVSAMKWNDFY